ncbi:MAG: hypothetical protein AVDCRST_MAG77-1131 [uncultured Chloroflexi bacterium]|uniref:Uncharacterized protein n=1 Tax=uncultured Chloroflexota bacterium TaxID=166587 RepID=A0A6J4HVC6_9CHLR|nr:MAG: hypothetical protein AVDCRST_MAG77-1131 [uncultured Chloroflexota bacterium]
MQCDEPHPGVRDLLLRIEAALTERRELLAGPDAGDERVRDYVDALCLRITWLLDRLAQLYPPAAALKDQAAVPGEFDRFLDRGDAQRRAG